MRRITALIVGVVAMLAMAVTPAFAHFSFFTGHGSDGYYIATNYLGDWNGCDWVWDSFHPADKPLEYVACGHWHQYQHKQATYWLHTCWTYLENPNLGHSGGRAVNYWYNPQGCFQYP